MRVALSFPFFLVLRHIKLIDSGLWHRILKDRKKNGSRFLYLQQSIQAMDCQVKPGNQYWWTVKHNQMAQVPIRMTRQIVLQCPPAAACTQFSRTLFSSEVSAQDAIFLIHPFCMYHPVRQHTFPSPSYSRTSHLARQQAWEVKDLLYKSLLRQSLVG